MTMCGICELAPAGDHDHVGYLVQETGHPHHPGTVLWFPHDATPQDAADRWLAKQQARSYGADLRVYRLGERVEFKAQVVVKMNQVRPKVLQ